MKNQRVAIGKNSAFVKTGEPLSALFSVNTINLLRSVLLFAFILYFVNTGLAQVSEKDPVVQKAYRLRLEGKADQARSLLENFIKRDSANAMAWYELSRTLGYMNLRNEATAAIDQAVDIEPENVNYVFGQAQDCYLKAYISMTRGGSDVKDLVGKACDRFEKVIDLKPDFPEAIMYLVEMYGILPEASGGNKMKAAAYSKKLGKLNMFYGAKADLTLMSDTTDKVRYWKDFIRRVGETPAALKELGVAYLYRDDEVNANKWFKKAMSVDPAQQIRLLDLARYHMMKAMQNQELTETEAPKAKQYIEAYLATHPEPIAPLEAYAYGMLAQIEMHAGTGEEAERLVGKARELDRHFSRFFAIPSPALFEPPGQLNHHFVSFFSIY